uniref:C2H2-type domain-containing protein n=1 Tax=Plectus sambesii TaxID=2011161 RepID=A0A914VJG7_9BILA
MPPSSTTTRNQNKEKTESGNSERCLCCPGETLIEKTALRQHLTDVHSKALAKALLMPDPNNAEELWLHRVAFQSIQASSCSPTTNNDQKKVSVVKRKRNDQAPRTAKTAPLMPINKRIRKPSLIVRESMDTPEISRTNKVHNRGKKVEKSMAINIEKGNDEVPPSSPSKPTIGTNETSEQMLAQVDSTCRQCGVQTQRQANHVLLKHMKTPMYECPLCSFSSDYFERNVIEHIETVHKLHPNLIPLDNRRRYSEVYQKLLVECFGGDTDDAKSPSGGQVTSSPRSSQDNSEEPKKLENDEMIGSPTLRRTRRRIVKNGQGANGDVAISDRSNSKKTKKTSKVNTESDDDSDNDETNDRATATRATTKKRRQADPDDDDDFVPQQRRAASKKVPRPSIAANAAFQQQPWAPNRPPPKTSLNTPVDLTDPDVCHMCRQAVPLMRKRHVLQYHFPTAVYECSVCEFVSYAQSSVHKHVESAHEGAQPPALAVSHLADMAAQIADMQRKCFPLQAIRRVFKTRRKSLFKFSTVRATDGRELVYCKLCDDGIKEKAFRHVLEHLDQPVYACRYCTETSPTDLTSIRKHIQRCHEEESEQEPLVHIANYQAEIDALYEQCFEKVPRQADERLFKRKVPAKRPRKPKKPPTNWQM